MSTRPKQAQRYLSDLAVGESGYVSYYALYFDYNNKPWLNMGAAVDPTQGWFRGLLVKRLEHGFAVQSQDTSGWEAGAHCFESGLAPVVELGLSA